MGYSASAGKTLTAKMDCPAHVYLHTDGRLLIHYVCINPRRACAARVAVYSWVCVSDISPMERLFVLKTLSRIYSAGNEGQKFVGFSLKLLRCRDPALPPLCGRAYSLPFFLLKARVRIIVWASPRPLFFPSRRNPAAARLCHY